MIPLKSNLNLLPIAIKNISVDAPTSTQRQAEIKKLTALRDPVYQKNLEFAEAICKKVRAHVRYGTNTEQDARELGINYLHKIKKIDIIRDELEVLVNLDSKADSYSSIADNECVLTYQLVKKHQFAYCGELAKSAYVEAQQIPEITAISLCKTTIGEHAVLVIGEIIDGQWSADAVICDCWARKFYPMNQLEEMKKPEHDVKYAPEYYSPANFQFFSDWVAPTPYLAGDLVVEFSWSRNK